MRAHTNLRSAFRFTMMMAAATGVTFAASQASADTAGATGGPNSSTGTAALSFDMAQGLDTTIDTGFLGPSVAQVRAVVKIDPVKDGGPLYSIKMPKGAVVEASWAGDKKIVLKAANGSSSDGTIIVRHTLTPSLELKVSAFGLTAQFGFDGDKLINKIPGAKFAYDSKATQSFAPWGFTKVDTKLSAPDLANSVLFSETFANLSEIVTGSALDPNKWDGNIGVRAATKPTFSYKTTKVMLTGADSPITTLHGGHGAGRRPDGCRRNDGHPALRLDEQGVRLQLQHHHRHQRLLQGVHGRSAKGLLPGLGRSHPAPERPRSDRGRRPRRSEVRRLGDQDRLHRELR
jgi:hypothetical protein